jgi:hypothetical protein
MSKIDFNEIRQKNTNSFVKRSSAMQNKGSNISSSLISGRNSFVKKGSIMGLDSNHDLSNNIYTPQVRPLKKLGSNLVLGRANSTLKS